MLGNIFQNTFVGQHSFMSVVWTVMLEDKIQNIIKHENLFPAIPTQKVTVHELAPSIQIASSKLQNYCSK